MSDDRTALVTDTDANGHATRDDTDETHEDRVSDGDGEHEDDEEQTFNDLYAGQPAWDVDRPQPAIVSLAEAGAIDGPVLDVGCGTGENALYLAAEGFDVVGVDAAPRAIEQAQEKAADRDLDVTFAVGDALALGEVPAVRSLQPYGSAIDSAVYHQFAHDEVPAYLASVRSVLRSGGGLHLLAFSEREPDGWGPRRVPREELEATFADGWTLDRVERTTFAMRPEFLTRIDRADADGVHAWVASASRAD